MKLLNFVLSIVFLFSSVLTSIANENVKDTGHLLKTIALEQSKKVTSEINELGPCKAWNGTLISTCKKFKKGDPVLTSSSKRMTVDEIIYLSNFVKKTEEYEAYSDKNPKNSTVSSQ